MRGPVLLALLLSLLGARVANAQDFADGSRGQFGGCPTCGVYAYVDLPTPEQTVSASNFVIQGWGFECATGAPVNRVDLWYQDYDGFWKRLLQPDGALHAGAVERPDVRAVYAGACPYVPTNTGWYLVVTNPPPTGLRRIRINVWYGPYFDRQQRTYLVVR